MTWDEFVVGARAVSWLAYLGTASTEGRPHVAPVSPGFTKDTIWFATRTGSRKFRNLVENPRTSFHWPVGGTDGPGELFAEGDARLYTSEADRRRLWTEANLPFDPANFFGSPETPDLAFVETTVTSASILGPDFHRSFYRP
jgi:general stress protein 26